jgi:hypothetical protein
MQDREEPALFGSNEIRRGAIAASHVILTNLAFL